MKKTKIDLPYNFNPRHYQLPGIKNAMLPLDHPKKKKRIFKVQHRRSGKDVECINITQIDMMHRVGSYIYLLPEATHARKVIWDGIDSQGRRFIDYFHPALIRKKPNNTQMFFRNKFGSTFQVMGSNRYDTLRGMNPILIVFSEFQDHHPCAWDVVSPILRENGGIAIFQGTPRGENHFYDLYQIAKDDPDEWLCSYLTVRDTRKHDGSPVMSEADVDKERKLHPEEFIQQEYYCDFNAANVGSYYGKWIRDAENEGRIGDYHIDPELPVFTFWDLGVDDANAIWFMQYINGQIHLIDYYEDVGIGFPGYIKNVMARAEKMNIRFGDHFAPFDIEVREWGTGRSRIETAQASGIYFRKVPQLDIIDGINAARMLLPKMWFHKTNCKIGIKCLKHYHREYDEKRECYNDKPQKSWANHGADAMRYLAVGWQSYFANKDPRNVRHLPVYTP